MERSEITPLQQVAKLYYENNPTGRFETELAYYLQRGIVVVNESVALLARECSTKEKDSYLGGFDKWGHGDKDAWFVAYAAGDLGLFRRILGLFEHQHPYIVYYKHDHPHIIRTEQFLNNIHKIYGKERTNKCS